MVVGCDEMDKSLVKWNVGGVIGGEGMVADIQAVVVLHLRYRNSI